MTFGPLLPQPQLGLPLGNEHGPPHPHLQRRNTKKDGPLLGKFGFSMLPLDCIRSRLQLVIPHLDPATAGCVCGNPVSKGLLVMFQQFAGGQ